MCVTGGEPLAQPNCATLLARLCDAGYRVSIETSGAMDIHGLDPRVVRVMDWKTPGSGEESRNLVANVDALTPHDQVKFVLCDRADYEWAKRARQWADLGATHLSVNTMGSGLSPRAHIDAIVKMKPTLGT